MIDPILNTALNSINLASEKALGHANNISNLDNSTTSELANDIIGLKEAELQVKASTKVVKVANEMNDALLDILA